MIMAGLATMLASPSAPAQAEAMPSQTPELLGALHEVNETAMHIGTLAGYRGTTPEVRRFGTLLVRDHRAADDVVVRLSHHYGFIYAPRAPTGVVAEDAWLLRQLHMAHGPEFDRRFLAAVRGLESGAAISLRDARPHMSQNDMRKMADQLVPIFQQHVDIADQLEKAQP